MLAHLQEKTTWSHVPWTAHFFFSLCVLRKNLNAAKPPEQSKGVLQPARFGYTGQTEIFLSPKPQTFPSGVNSNHQRATSTHVYDRFPLIRMRPMNKSDDLFAGGGGCKSGTTNEAHQIQNKQVENSSQPGPKPKTTTIVDFQKGFLVGWF